MSSSESAPRPVDGAAAGPLLMVGGYGLVGAQAAPLLRRRHPDLPLVLAGRNPDAAGSLAAALGARTARVDVRAERPLAGLAERPAAILATLPDPEDRLLADAMREGIPIADIDRADAIAALDVTLRALRERPVAPVLLAGAWKGGTAALLAGALARVVPDPVRADLTVMISSRDRVGAGAWRFSRRWAWPHHPREQGARRVRHPFTDLRPVLCADGVERLSARISTLDQVTLPLTLDVPTVEARIVMLEAAKLWGLVALKRSGALRALDRPRLARVRRRLLERSGGGDVSGFTIALAGEGRTAAIDALDPHGQAHLGAVGAVLAAERVLGLTDVRLPAGVSFPEQTSRPAADLATLADAGIVLRARGCALSDLVDAADERAGSPEADALRSILEVS
jgi:hypothetical protein